MQFPLKLKHHVNSKHQMNRMNNNIR